jgi:geranylgeranyl pyrophosphate synthase
MIDAYQASSQARVNAALEPLFVAPSPELKRLYEAMRYSVMNGGKRVRRCWPMRPAKPWARPSRPTVRRARWS